jgi:hypothetical protein
MAMTASLDSQNVMILHVPFLSTNKRGLDKAGRGGCRFLPG